MFPTSTQFKNWTFSSEAELHRLRQETNAKFIAKHGANMRVRIPYLPFFALLSRNPDFFLLNNCVPQVING